MSIFGVFFWILFEKSKEYGTGLEEYKMYN